MVPNMTLVETQNAGNAFVVIRGISQARNSEPSVAVQVDGVLETNPAEFNQELYDIKQIEVLKGPQGALYGRNAIGGAIIITTKDPSDEFEANVKAGYGNEDSIRGAARRQRADHRHAGLPGIRELLRDRRLPRQRVPAREGGSRRGLSGRVRFVVEAERQLHRRPAGLDGRPLDRRRCTSTSRASTRRTRSAATSPMPTTSMSRSSSTTRASTTATC